MTNYKPILVATDLSVRCDRALDRAVMLAKDWRVKLYVLHVTEPKTGKGLGINTREIVHQIREELPITKVDIEILVKSGPVPDAIAETAKAQRCGLIVTGVARYNSLGDIFLGTAVDYLIRHTRAPVLVVKRKPMRMYKNILIATDFSDCSLHALNSAAVMFPDPTLHLVHAFHPPYQAWLKSDQTTGNVHCEEQRLMDRFLAKTAISDNVFDRLNASIEEGDLGQVLFSKIDKTKSDLVVLGTHGRSGFAHATMGSNAQAILGWAKQDVLMVRE